LSGCGSLGPRIITEQSADATPAAKPAPRGGGYYKDDGPGDNPPDMAAIPEPEPRVETLHRFANNPYNVFGVAYTPQRTLAPYKARGLGSWYGRKFHGQKTSSGEVYDMYGMTAAHPTLPIPSYARVTHVGNGRSVIVRVNDRGPFHPGRIIDLSYTAAWKLGYVAAGSTQVEVELLTPELIAALGRSRSTPTAPSPVVTAAASINAPVVTPVVTPTVTPVANPQAPTAQPVAAAAPVQNLPMDVQANGVFLQLAAFSAQDNAETFRARIYRELDWLNDRIQILQRDGLFRLHMGPYRDRTEAGSMAERLRSALQLNPMIVVR
jgi:rare lipoprotein A